MQTTVEPITVQVLTAGNQQERQRLYGLLAEILRSIAACEAEQRPKAA